MHARGPSLPLQRGTHRFFSWRHSNIWSIKSPMYVGIARCRCGKYASVPEPCARRPPNAVLRMRRTSGPQVFSSAQSTAMQHPRRRPPIRGLLILFRHYQNSLVLPRTSWGIFGRPLCCFSGQCLPAARPPAHALINMIQDAMNILLAILTVTVRADDEHSSCMDASKQGIQPVSYVPLEDLRFLVRSGF